MGKRIAMIQGHPDGQTRHFCHALADEYAKGCEDGGHEVRRIEVARLEFPLLRTKEEFEQGKPPESITDAQEVIRWAEHLVIVYPLWLGSMPALLQAFLEQVFRPGFLFDAQQKGKVATRLLAGKSARIVVTMGMPALVYRWFYFAHSLRNLQRNILGFCGIRPTRTTLVGGIEGLNEGQRAAWLDRLRVLGDAGR